jgi:threonine synthase
MGKTQGIWPAPEGGATLAAFLRLQKQGWIGAGETVVLFNTGNGAKYSHIWD